MTWKERHRHHVRALEEMWSERRFDALRYRWGVHPRWRAMDRELARRSVLDVIAIQRSNVRRSFVALSGSEGFVPYVSPGETVSLAAVAQVSGQIEGWHIRAEEKGLLESLDIGGKQFLLSPVPATVTYLDDLRISPIPVSSGQTVTMRIRSAAHVRIPVSAAVVVLHRGEQ